MAATTREWVVLSPLGILLSESKTELQRPLSRFRPRSTAPLDLLLVLLKTVARKHIIIRRLPVRLNLQRFVRWMLADLTQSLKGETLN